MKVTETHKNSNRIFDLILAPYAKQDVALFEDTRHSAREASRENVLKVTLCIIHATSGANNYPVGGDATFDDGRSYGWSRHADEVRFFGSRKVGGQNEMRSFSAPARASALTATLDGNDPDARVMRGSDYGDFLRQGDGEDQDMADEGPSP